MFRNYLKIAWRNLIRNKVNTSINVAGLAIGLAACLLLLTYLQNELSYDAFHANAVRIVRVTMEYSAGGEVGRVATTGTKVAPELARTFTEIEAAARLIDGQVTVRVGDRHFAEKRLLYADSSLFSIFSFPFLKGDPAQALAGPNLVVLSEATVARYFGTQNPVGRVLRVNTGGANDKLFTVTGVVANCPVNSQIKYDLIASFSTLQASKTEEWWSANYGTYLLLRSPEAIASLQKKIKPFMQSKAGETRMTGGDYLTYTLEPLRDVHLRSAVGGLFEPSGDLTYCYVLGVISLLILLIACVNYINLATARAIERAREVGVRKVLGAERGQLFGQFMGESVLVMGAALLMGIGLAALGLPWFNSLASTQFTAGNWLTSAWVVGMLGVGLVVAVVAGGYPAWVLARYRPTQTLQGRMTAGGSGLRRGLIVFQFAVTAFLLVSTLVVRNQLDFIQHKKLGYTRDRVLVLPANEQVADKIRTLKSEFRRNGNVASVSLAYESPVFINGGYSMRRGSQSAGQDKIVTGLVIDDDFVSTMGLRLVAGQNLTTADMVRVNRADVDSVDRFRFILNEAGVKAMGWTPQTAIGQRIGVNGRAGTVKAVVADFHFASLKQQIGPLVLFHQGGGNVVLVKLSGGPLPETLTHLERTWKTLLPGRPFEYRFMDEEFNNLYVSELRTGRIVSVFAFLSIFLGCLGLFGLSAYTTAQRTKEIGVRKVLGASVTSIVALLSKDFLKLVLIAIVIASPIAWYAMNRWLQDFAYKIDIEWWVFALAGTLAVGIALLTVSFQSIKAALMNPVKSLRSE